MRSLDEVRNDINETDKELARLFERRMNLSKEVADYKRANGLPVFDAAREAAVIARFTGALANKAYAPWATRIICDLMDCSKEYQRQFMPESAVAAHKDGGRVVCQGAPGAYGEEAACAYFGETAQIDCLSSFEDVFAAVSSGEAAYGVVPIENSSTGAIGDVYDLFTRYDCKIAGEYILPISHNLLANEGATPDTVKSVYSHTQGFEQSSNFLRKHPDYNCIPYHNTAVSAKFVAESGGTDKAAIASLRAAKLYNLKVLAQAINNNYNNYTRFIIIARDIVTQKEANKVSVLFGLMHKEGQLCKLMAHFAEYRVNLLKIESRPIPNRSWEYNFYIDFEANLQDNGTQELLEKLCADAVSFRLLGNYKAANTHVG